MRATPRRRSPQRNGRKRRPSDSAATCNAASQNLQPAGPASPRVSEIAAATHGAAAVELLAGTSYVALHGRALELLGRSLAVDDRAGAVEALTEAVGVFESCGASARRERVLEELRRLGSSRPEGRGGGEGPGLSHRARA